MSLVYPSTSTPSARFRGLERIDGTCIVLAEILATLDELKPWAAVLRFELRHALSRAFRGDASIDGPVERAGDYLLEGAVFSQPLGRCASFSMRRIAGDAVVWTDRMTASSAGAWSDDSDDILRLTRGIVMALRIDGARRARSVGDRAALRAWAELWTRPQTEATNGAAFKALASVPAQRMRHGCASPALAYAYWRGARYGWNGLAPAEAAACALTLANDAVERAPCDADARFVLAMAQFPAGDDRLAEAHLRAAIETDPSHAPAHGNLGFALLRQGRIDAAQGACETALSISPREPLGCVWHASLSFVHAHRGDVAGARREAARAVAANPNHRFGWLASAVAAGAAASHEDARRYVDRLAALGPCDGVGPEFWPWCEPLLDTMRSTASPRRDCAPRRSPGLRITTLGSFRVEREGRRIEWQRKLPRRPLEILKFLVVHDGTPVAPAVLMDALWPDEAGPHVRRRLDTALYRLRRIVGTEAIVSTNGMISLSASIELDTRRFAGERDPDAYTGTFLPDDIHVAWTVPLREALRERLQSLLLDRAERLLYARRYDEAIAACESGIAHHPTAESLYRLAIRACRLAGRRGDGTRIYERCRRCLGSELGLRPSRATEDELMQLIRNQ